MLSSSAKSLHVELGRDTAIVLSGPGPVGVSGRHTAPRLKVPLRWSRGCGWND